MAAVNGIVTNLDLLPGRYVNAGAAVFALIGSDTFRVEGYFEETKLRRIRIGEDATVKLIGDPRVLSGHVESIAYGIEDQNWLSKDLAGVPLPVNADIPPAIDIAFVDEVDTRSGPLGAKGIGELGATGVAAAVANAVYDAIGLRVRDLPITPDKILTA